MDEKNMNGMVGGWVLDPKPCIHGALPQKLATAFCDLFMGLDGVGYAPLVYCGHQLVNGTNYMMICKMTSITEKPKTSIVKIILHETLPSGGIFGEFSVLSNETIVEEAVAGGYNLKPFPYLAGDLSHDPIHEAFEEAKKGFVGSSITPLAFCGTQMPSPDSTNQMFICKSSVVGSEKVNHIATVVLNKKDGAFTIANITDIV